MKMNRRKALKNKIMPQDILTEDHDFGVENGEKQSRRNTDHLYTGKYSKFEPACCIGLAPINEENVMTTSENKITHEDFEVRSNEDMSSLNTESMFAGKISEEQNLATIKPLRNPNR